MDRWSHENLFYLTSDKSRIKKLIDHYEIYKKISKINGDIIECGVFKGAGLMFWLKLLSIYEPDGKIWRQETGASNLPK